MVWMLKSALTKLRKRDTLPVSFSEVIRPLLQTLGWSGSSSYLNELISGQSEEVTEDKALSVISYLGWNFARRKSKLRNIRSELYPILFVTPQKVFLLRQRYENFVEIYDPVTKKFMHVEIPNKSGHFIRFSKRSLDEETLNDPQMDWFRKIISRFNRPLLYVFFISLVLSVLAVIAPLIVMVVFGQISIISDIYAIDQLWFGIVAYLSAMLMFRLVRSYLMSMISARVRNIISIQVLRRILFLPPSYTELASLTAQLTRIRDFDSIQAFISGKAAIALLELPFVVILIFVQYHICMPISLVTISVAVIFLLSGFLVKKVGRKTVKKSSLYMKEKRDFLIDAFSNLVTIRKLFLVEQWKNQFNDLSLKANVHSVFDRRLQILLSAFSQYLIACAGLVTIWVGVDQIFAHKLDAGGLMGSMMITWRILAPLKSSFNVSTQIDKLRHSIDQVDKLMNLPIEAGYNKIATQDTEIEGRVSFNMVSLRYSKDANPALLGVNFDIESTETVVVIGHDSSGKSSILKLILGMYYPQSGRVLIDNLNSKQINPMSLRKQIAYMPENSFFFKGSLRDNILLVDPEGDTDAIEMALSETGLLEEIDRLPAGLDTILDERSISSFSESFLRRFGMALMFIKKSNLWLLDNPGYGLGEDHERQFLATLAAAKGLATIIISTQNTEYFSIADKVLWMNEGRMKAFDTPDKVEKMMQKQFAITKAAA